MNFIVGIIALLLVVLSLLLIAVFFLGNQNNNNKKKYTDIVNKTNLEKEVQKEVNGRRRITPKTKQAILERDNYTCQICGISKQFLDDFCEGLGDYLLLEVDHIESVANGGNKEQDNLQVLCWRCNRKKGGKKTNAEVKAMIDYGIAILKSKLEKKN